MEAVRIIKENQLEHRPTKIIFSVAEEIGLLGAKNLEPEELKGLKYGFVLDGDGKIGAIINQGPGPDKIQYGDKGTGSPCRYGTGAGNQCHQDGQCNYLQVENRPD